MKHNKLSSENLYRDTTFDVKQCCLFQSITRKVNSVHSFFEKTIFNGLMKIMVANDSYYSFN